MDLKEAEEYYKRFNGREFHMGRENMGAYKEFLNLQIPEETLKKWRQEMIQDMLLNFWGDQDSVWIKQSHLIELIHKENTQKNVEKLLDQMEKMPVLDKHQRILVVENVAGRDAKYKEGLCSIMKKYPNLCPRFKEIMNQILDFKVDETDNINQLGWKNVVKRYAEAKEKYLQACRMYLV